MATRGRGLNASLRRCAVAMALLLGLAPFVAAAQDSYVQLLADRVDRLQQELTDLQRNVYGDGAAGGGEKAAGTTLDANQEVRLEQIDTELRGLTGQIEEVTFRTAQLSERLDKLIADVDFRLRALEEGGGAPLAAAAPPLAPGAAAPEPAPPPPGGDQVLGQLTQSQLAGPGAAPVTAAGAPQPLGQQQAATPGALSGATPEAQYQNAFGLLRQANYGEAEAALRAFIEQHPDHALAGNAQYWLGETFYVRGDYAQAAVAFADGYKRYPAGQKAADNLLKLGMSLTELGQKADACAAFVELGTKFPDAPANVKERAARERERAGCA